MNTKAKTAQIAALNVAVTFVVEEILKNEFVFPDGKITGKDFEQVYLYAITLFDFHDHINGRKLGESITMESLHMMFDMLKNNFSYSADQITALQSNITEEMRKYAIAYDELISKKTTEDSIRKYVSDVLQHFPSAESTSSFSFAGVAFATLVTANIKYVSETYDTLVAIPETFEKAAKKSTPTNDDFIIEDLTQKPASPKTKKPVALIACVVALICSLFGNIYLFSESRKIVTETEAKADYWEEAYDDIYLTCYQLADALNERLDEYYFFHDRAVIITEQNRYYHRYTCKTLDLSYYWIHNTEYAKMQGYAPCPTCNPGDKHISKLVKESLENLIESAPKKPIGPYKP